MTEQIFTNVRLVLENEVVTGSLAVRNGQIARFDDAPSHIAAAIDGHGDYLLPGLIDLHTDNLERQVEPRPKARLPSRSALAAHDGLCAAAGITTVLDALCIGDLGFDGNRSRTAAEGIADITALNPLLKSEHFLHLRCEIPAADMTEKLAPAAGNPLIRLISLMDHSPGVGQYHDLDYYRFVRRLGGRNDAEIDADIDRLQTQRARLRPANRQLLLETYRGRVPLASHDDRTEQEVAENHADGIAISEFPVTSLAAAAARQRGIGVIGGSPNVVRGGSHSGNVSVAALAEAGHLDALASDYVPSTMLEAIFLLPVPLHQAAAMVTATPARMLGLTDRGRLAEGLRADLLRVTLHQGLPLPRAVWRAGRRIA